MAATNVIVVFCTAPDEATAQELTSLLLREKLAACVTLLPGVSSFYYWQGRLEQAYEVQMLIKSHFQKQDALLACLQQHHPYQVPELLVLPVQAGGEKYLSWLDASLA